MLTKSDIELMQDIFGKQFRVILEEVLDQKLEEKLTEKLGKYPTKDEFYEQTLKILKKLDDLEIEKDILSNHSTVHSDRIEALEKIHPKGKHTLTLQ